MILCFDLLRCLMLGTTVYMPTCLYSSSNPYPRIVADATRGVYRYVYLYVVADIFFSSKKSVFLFVYCFYLFFCSRAWAGSALHGVPEGQDRRPSRPPLRSSQTGQGFVGRRNPPRRPSSLVSLCPSVSYCKNYPTMFLVFNSLKCTVAVLPESTPLPSFPA